MTRALSAGTIYRKKYTKFNFTGVYKEVFGEPSTSGIWLLYGVEKNGKSWGALLLANYLANFGRILYVSAEEGTEMEFKEALKRAKIDGKNKKLRFVEYEPIDELYQRLQVKNRERKYHVVFIDNLTIYNDELKARGIKQLKQDFPNTLFVLIAHEERGKPYTASATMASKLAKVLMRVQGLQIQVFGRVPGGILNIDENKAKLFHGTI
ncbi:hypothetical protein G1L22_12920 [Tenacibaculum finnmarkense]|uniref:hypothetical protein n=1 Tax=Tenacibaculum finnmarkense TaxID=2781243 RepID=UPI000C7DE00D|nr:hypothetical protein [Tenacibaculum finnmarkense]MDB0599690.1 hypothetical protein [Tenacibaculum maritimum]SOU86404.1 conserved hypothetical protein [Tenacibaculum dicentrarchi]MBE7649187.1 hypothetical protein [Tenacibaculum finnmarkense genomovar ulcerans]MCG8740002.1 hypothetical protein [Tenacibaculum finnmarkense]MCG8762106.1 hypothetical protein [Tenacibaculum finnmarkense]